MASSLLTEEGTLTLNTAAEFGLVKPIVANAIRDQGPCSKIGADVAASDGVAFAIVGTRVYSIHRCLVVVLG
jgi:hypothetical protein